MFLYASVERLQFLQKELTKGVEHYDREDKKQYRWNEYDDVGCGHRMNDRKAFFFDKGFIRVVPDKEFYRVRMEDVKLCQNEKGEEVKWSAGGDAGNTFDHALRAVYPMAADYRAQRHAYKTLGLNTPILGENNRIEEAETLREFARVSKVIKPEEADMAQVNERRAKENMLRRLGDAAEQKYLDKHPQERAQHEAEERQKLEQIAAMS